MQAYERLGVFYLGRMVDPASGETTADPLLYDAKDLTTHAVCVGMTGSGKTGLCVSLLEEAAIDGIPVIAIDPKGDVGNLLLTFPELKAADFAPWVDSAEAVRKGLPPEQYPARVAETWRNGLASWDQDGERIARLRAAADLSIYTPGSSAGLPLRVLSSLAAPPPGLAADSEALGERVMAVVSGLLGLLGIDADPIRSREQILLSLLLQNAWREGRGLAMTELVREVQSPPVNRVGVLDLETFYPAKERFALAMALNNLLASPGFTPWMEGEPLDVARLLWTAEGKPRVSILSISHLDDAQRMFFVTLLLNEVLGWVRTQPGTSSLRAILYMDEVFGYFPPTANPPSKKPMLTLLKQARAFGLGCVLATQNPVDLDYKGLSNAGTWFLGRLQTERDKERVLGGLESASASAGAHLDRKEAEKILSGLKSRVFLMHNVHEDHPALFHTRWALSYLRGPLSREQIAGLMGPKKASAAPPPAAPATAAKVEAKPPAGRPVIPPEIREHFFAPGRPVSRGSDILYRPALLGSGKLHYVSARTGLDAWFDFARLAPLDAEMKGAAGTWEDSTILAEGKPVLEGEPMEGARFEPVPAPALAAKNYGRWSKDLARELYRSERLRLWKCAMLKETSRPGEMEGDFRARLALALRERRDLEVEKLRKKYAPKLARLGERIETARGRVDREKGQYRSQKFQSAVSVGATLLGALFGRKVASTGTVGRATTAVRGMGRAAREKGDVGRAEESLRQLEERLEELEAEFHEETERVQESLRPEELELVEQEVRPRKADIQVDDVLFVWAPWITGAPEAGKPAWT